MQRRNLLVGLVSLGLLGGGSFVAFGGGNGLFQDETVPETTLETIDARGSQAGETVVPERGSVTVVDFFATWCSDCDQYLGTLAEFHRAVPESVQFVSVTTEQVGSAVTRGEISNWFNGEQPGTATAVDPTAPRRGNWTVALDPSLSLAEPMGATQVPHSVVVDESNRIAWSDPGVHTVDELEAALAQAGINAT
jgi:thiol-disulfide isomerase/thioredoxin